MCHLVQLFSVCVSCLLSHRENVTHLAATAIQVSSRTTSAALSPFLPTPPQSLLEDVVGPYIESLDAKATAKNSPQMLTLQKTYM